MIEVVYNRDRPFDINLTHLIDLIDCNIKNPEFDDSGKEMKVWAAAASWWISIHI